MKKKSVRPLVALIMGSESDWPVMQDASKVLKDFGIAYEVEIVSAHRTPEKMVGFAQEAAQRGLKVIIAGAGGAAHLPGMVASLTTLPVVGVPVQIGSLKGLDALLSIAQMPKGVPVATMAVDNSFNAGLFAVRLLAISDATLANKLSTFQVLQKNKVAAMNKKLHSRSNGKTRSKSTRTSK